MPKFQDPAQDVTFIPPEAFGSSFAADAEMDPGDFQNLSSWDVATRYHEFKTKKSSPGLVKNLRRLSAQAILERAQEVLGSVVHPVEQKLCTMDELPAFAEHAELDLEETLENSPLVFSDQRSRVAAPVTANDIWLSYTVPRRQPLVLSVDTSLSMTGEKLALTAVALAVVLLEFPEDPIGIVAFENEAMILKHPEERITIGALVERFLDVPAQGYTHLEEGMKAALGLVRKVRSAGQGKPPSTVLLTDGKYTAGKDPTYLGTRFPHLVVLKMGTERASWELCRDLAKRGQGSVKEVGKLEMLPEVMYGVVKDLLRR